MISTIQARPITLQISAKFAAIIRPEPEVGGFSAEVPALPGCCTQGESLDEVQANLRDAIEGWLAVAHDAACSDGDMETAE